MAAGDVVEGPFVGREDEGEVGFSVLEHLHRDEVGLFGHAVPFAADDAGDVGPVAVVVGGGAGVAEGVVGEGHAAAEVGVVCVDAGVQDVGVGAGAGGADVPVGAGVAEAAVGDAMEVGGGHALEDAALGGGSG